jgi:GTP pyrophosphokinase
MKADQSRFTHAVKMKAQNVSFDGVWQIALRIVYKSSQWWKFLALKNILDCNRDHYRPSPSRLRDWILTQINWLWSLAYYRYGDQKVDGRTSHEANRQKGQLRSDMQRPLQVQNGATEESGLDVWLNLPKRLWKLKSLVTDFVEDLQMNLYSQIYILRQKEILKSSQRITSLCLKYSFWNWYKKHEARA